MRRHMRARQRNLTQGFTVNLRRHYHPLLEALEQRVLLTIAPSNFDASDGNLIIDAAEDDWANAPSLVTKTEAFIGQNDDSLGQGTKEDTACSNPGDPLNFSGCPTVKTGSIPPNKSDLQRFYVANEQVAGQEFLYLAWIRNNILGTANMDFEFNQSDQVKNNPANGNQILPLRTDGDMLVNFDFASGGNVVNLSLSRWTDTGPCEANGASAPCWGTTVDLDASGVAEGSVNNGVAVFDPIEGVNLSDRTFGEASINLTAAGVFQPGVCTNFGSAYLKSRSSDSFTASLKDLIAPAAVSISNCGSITIRKDTVPDQGQDFNFTSTSDTATDLGAFTLDDDGDNSNTHSNNVMFINAFAGNYTVTEAAVPGFELTAINCTSDSSSDTMVNTATGTATISLAALGNVDCTFVNTGRPDVTVQKSASVPMIDAGGTFGYTITASNTSAALAQGVVVTDDLDDDLIINGNVTYNVDPGNTGVDGNCTVGAGNVITCNVGTLAGDDGVAGGPDTVEIAISVTAPPSSCPSVSNMAHVSATNEDLAQQGNNDSNPVNVIVKCPDVVVTKSSSLSSVAASGMYSYTITAENLGAGPATGVVVTDDLNDHLIINGTVDFDIDPSTGVDGSCSTGPGNTNQITCNVGTLAASDGMANGPDTVVIIINVTAPAETCGTVTNTSSVSATNEPLSAQGNNSSSPVNVDVTFETRTILFDPDGSGPRQAREVTVFDQSPGNTLAIGALGGVNDAGTAIGRDIRNVSQATMSALIGENGKVINIPQLGDAFQLVTLAEFWEHASTPAGGNATIFTNPLGVPPSPSQVQLIYKPTPPDPDNRSGAGFAFDAGNLDEIVLTADITNIAGASVVTNPTPQPLDQAAGADPMDMTQTVEFAGSTTVIVSANIVANPLFFPEIAAGTRQLTEFRSSSLNSTPFLQVGALSSTGQFFDGTMRNIGTINGVHEGAPDTVSDVLFQTDSSTSLIAQCVGQQIPPDVSPAAAVPAESRGRRPFKC